MMSQQWFFHWDNAPLLIAAMVSSWCNARGVQWLEHLPYLPNLAPADFFLLKKKPKWGLAGRSLDQDGIKNAWEGVTRSLIAVDFAAAFRSWLERCKKCDGLGGEFTEKILRNKRPPSSNRCQFIIDLHLFVFTPRVLLSGLLILPQH
jgi:hypothetical protein